jgi:hypothetical protein
LGVRGKVRASGPRDGPRSPQHGIQYRFMDFREASERRMKYPG